MAILPNELLQKVIRNLAQDEASLRQCNAASRLLNEMVHPIIFNKVKIIGRSEYTKASLAKLARAIDTIAPDIKNFELMPFGLDLMEDDAAKVLVTIAQKSRLTTLSLHCSYPCDDVLDVIWHMASQTTIRDLDIGGLPIRADLLQNKPNLHRLSIASTCAPIGDEDFNDLYPASVEYLFYTNGGTQNHGSYIIKELDAVLDEINETRLATLLTDRGSMITRLTM